jgi:hypothetical protein
VDPAATGHKRGAITAIATAVPQRTRKAVWQFVRSNYTPTEVVGKWSSAEDAKLLELYAELGPKWKEIGDRLGRLDRACRDRCRDLNYGQPLNTGTINATERPETICSTAVAAAAAAGRCWPLY